METIENAVLRARADSLHNLICDMLRGPHVASMSGAQLARFTYLAGVALHNLPHAMLSSGGLAPCQLEDVNALDPSAEDGSWGRWATELADGFGIALPPTPRHRAQ